MPRDFIGDVSKINFEFCCWPRLEFEAECWIVRDDNGELCLRVDDDKPNEFVVRTVVSIVNRTVGGLIELARSELDEAILAWRRRSIDARRSNKQQEGRYIIF